MREIAMIFGCLIGGLILPTLATFLITTICSFVMMDWSYYQSVLDFINPWIHMWVRIVLVIYVIICIILGTTFAQFR